MKFDTNNINQNSRLHKRYNRKLWLSYDRLEIMIRRYWSDVAMPSNMISVFVGSFISILSTIVSLTSASFEQLWMKPCMVLLCIISSIYYIAMAIKWYKHRMSIDDFLDMLDKDNELNK